jgi:hypothetical protein
MPCKPEQTRMATKYTLVLLAIAFFAAAGLRYAKGRTSGDPATRTWLLIALIFTAVAAWLQWHTS